MHKIPIPPPETGLILDNGRLREMTDEERKAANINSLLPEMDAFNRKIHNLLASLGFLPVSCLDSRQRMMSMRYVYQRKTPQTNIIVESDFDVVKVAHGSAKIDLVYGIIWREEALTKLERIIHSVSLQQIDESLAQMPQE